MAAWMGYHFKGGLGVRRKGRGSELGWREIVGSATEDAWCELVNVLSFLRAASNNISICCLVPYPGVTFSEILAGRACVDGGMGKERLGVCDDEMGRIDRWRLIGGGVGDGESHIKIHTCTSHTPHLRLSIGTALK